MSNERLLQEVRNEACSCDMMMGWTCSFCRITLPKLRKALNIGRKKPFKRMKCKKPPKYQAKRYPTSECGICLHIWNQKKGAERVMDKVDREYMGQLKRLDPPCDARAYAEHFANGGDDIGGRARM